MVACSDGQKNATSSQVCALQVICILSYGSASSQSFSDVCRRFLPSLHLDLLTPASCILEIRSSIIALTRLPGFQAMANCAGHKTNKHTVNSIQELRLSIPPHSGPMVVPEIDYCDYFFRAKSTLEVLYRRLTSEMVHLACK